MDIRPIDANALVARFEELKSNPNNSLTDVIFLDGAMSVVDVEPTLDYEPVRHGEWVEEIEPNVVTASGRDVHLWRCSVCGFSWANKHDVMSYYKHCPNCGARMYGGKENGHNE